MNMLRQRLVMATLATLTAGFLAATPASAVAVTCTAGTGSTCAPVVTATVAATLTFNVTITELINNGTQIGPVVAAMNFGPLASNGTFVDPVTGQTKLRSLNALKAFQVFFGINAQQRPFSIRQSSSGIGLASGTIALPPGSFVVTPLQGVGGDLTKPLPAGISVAPSRTAIGTSVELFSRATTGPSDTMAATYGITDDPAHGATGPGIPLDQPAGTYTTTITFTATVI